MAFSLCLVPLALITKPVSIYLCFGLGHFTLLFFHSTCPALLLPSCLFGWPVPAISLASISFSPSFLFFLSLETRFPFLLTLSARKSSLYLLSIDCLAFYLPNQVPYTGKVTKHNTRLHSRANIPQHGSMPVIPALRKPRQENCSEFIARLGYRVSSLCQGYIT